MKVIEPLQDLVTVLSQIPNLRLLKWSKNSLRGQLRPWKSAKTMEVAVKRVIIWCGYWISNWIFSTSQKPLTRTKVSRTLFRVFNVSTLSKPKVFTSNHFQSTTVLRIVFIFLFIFQFFVKLHTSFFFFPLSFFVKLRANFSVKTTGAELWTWNFCKNSVKSAYILKQIVEITCFEKITWNQLI